MFLPCMPMGAFSAFVNSVTMLVVIHTFLFVLYFIGSIFIFFKHNFDGFQTIDWRPSLPFGIFTS